MQKKGRYYIQSLRLERWPRSLAILPGIIAFYALYPHLAPPVNPGLLLRIFAAFLLTWMVSTANYIINEIADAPFDAFHPDKKDRPLVRRKISWKILMMIWLGLVTVAGLTAFLCMKSIPFLASLGALLAAGFVYNLKPVRVKDVPFLDSTAESANNPIRFLIGWFVIGDIFPPWSLLVAWWAFGNYLMIGKRAAEKKFLTASESAGYRRSLSRYSYRSLIIFMVFNALLFTATFVWFALSSGLHTILYTLPLVIVYILIFFRKSLQDKEGAEEPEKLLKNPYFALYTLLMAVAFLLAYVLK